MKRRVILSLICASYLYSEELATIVVSDTVDKKVVDSVNIKEIKSADLAEALSKNSPSISMIRRSGIANDIVIRGQKRDNINVIVDGAKIYGACPNRMDPPTSHVLTNNIEKVEVKEGSFDVENFGTLSALVDIKTKEPKSGVEGEINLNAGSFDYRKMSATISGGTDKIKALVGISYESSGQYEDGDGNTLAEQNANSAPTINQYKDKSLDAYEKKSLLSKLYFNLTDNQQIKLSYTANRSDDVLYANTAMDAIRDDSDIYTFNYTAKELSKYSKELSFESYYSTVEHPMATTFRNNGAMEMTNNMFSKIKGAKLKNSMELGEDILTVGIDSSKREWSGYYSTIASSYLGDSISKTMTENRALFLKYEDIAKDNSFGFEYGVRYDDTQIDGMSSEDYESLNGYIYSIYKSGSDKYFFGVGKSSRVPDARELFFQKSGVLIGTPNLKETKNYEVDLGFEKVVGDFKIKTKAFYSVLDDYIVYNNKITTANKFENVDAKIYGLELSGFYYFTDELSLDYSATYQRGKKDEALTNATDRDLADIAPLKGFLALNYEYKNHTFNTSFHASDSWEDFDMDSDEQSLSGYAVTNIKYNNQVTKAFDVTLGVDNIFDKTYAVSNTSADLTLLVSGAGEKVLLNEPGRYSYINLRYKF